MSDLSRLLAPLARRLSNLLARGTVVASTAATKMQTLQLKLLADEMKDGVEHFEPYGFTSRPLPGAEVLAVFMDGDRSHGVVVVAADRRYRLRTLAPGEVAIHDHLGNHVHFKADGSLAILATGGVAITGNLTVSGTINGAIDVIGGGKSLKGHTHTGGGSGPPA